ncbi:hypothetical protein AeMF1_021607 [Aphanomyces euteiches]|nr:hypothetical protein AeMF1_021607 [Aphanomyces euteiches]
MGLRLASIFHHSKRSWFALCRSSSLRFRRTIPVNRAKPLFLIVAISAETIEALNDKSTLSDLKLNGKKAIFTSWKARFVAHLNALSTTTTSSARRKKKPYHLQHPDYLKFRPIIEVEELAKALKLDSASDVEAIEAEKSKMFHYLRMQECGIRGILGKVLPNELLVQLRGTVNNSNLQIHDVWMMLEREYGQTLEQIYT